MPYRINRPLYNGNTETSFDITDLLQSHIETSTYSILNSDFNIRVNDNSNSYTKCLHAILNDFALVQQVTEPTHIKGNILDLVIMSNVTDHRQSYYP